jgi:hypothetical protein
MEYYVVKSGMQMYDLSKAYGLGLILQKLSDSIVNVKDFGYYYLVDTKTEYDFEKIKEEKIKNLAELLLEESNKKWGYLFLTLKGERRVDKIKELKRLIINKKIISTILDKFKSIKQPEFFDSKKEENETLYQSLDLGATKGFREKIKGLVYHEGSQLYVPKEDFLLSVIGHLNFTIWKWKMEKKAGQLIMILFNPSSEGIRIGISPDARDITKGIDDFLITHKAGIFPTLSYAAVLLAKEISLQKERIVKFSNLIFGIMVGSGQQRKPYGGGVYPLDFLHKIINSTEKATEIFEQWINVFKLTNQPGHEDLALYLSEFITYPSKDTLEKYLKAHLRIFLSREIKPKLYEYDIIKEVIRNV